MLIIRHLTGPLAGKEERLDPTLDRVAFGRGLDCQVVYPPEETIVAREHFALVRRPPGPAGHWTIDLFGEPFVAVNGVAADPEQTLPAQATFELGKHGGPSFKVEVMPDAAGDNFPRTVAQEPQERPRILAVKAGERAQFARRLAVAVLAVAVAAIAAGSYYAYQQSQLTISADVRERLTRAAFFVRSPEHVATAWPVGPHMLATNAHVVEDFEKLKPGQVMTVRAPGQDGKVYQVVDYKVHPGWRAFSKFDVLQKAVLNIAGIAGYDVGLLIVKEELPAQSILQIASDEELRGLSSGTIVAAAGYPAETVPGSPVRNFGATPELHVGIVTSTTDFFFLPADFENRQLVHHDLPSGGGASGSPIVGRSGHVIAVHSAGSYYFPSSPKERRIPSGTQINYGQRVDVLRQLISGTAERELPETRKYWSERAKILPRGADRAASIVASQIGDQLKKRVDIAKVSEVTATLSDAPVSQNGVLQRQKSHSVEPPTDSNYFISAYAEDGSPITLWLYADNQLKASSSEGSKFVRWVALGPERPNTNLTAWVISTSAQPVTYTLQVHRYQVH
jgi:hypothetical protein